MHYSLFLWLPHIAKIENVHASPAQPPYPEKLAHGPSSSFLQLPPKILTKYISPPKMLRIAPGTFTTEESRGDFHAFEC